MRQQSIQGNVLQAGLELTGIPNRQAKSELMAMRFNYYETGDVIALALLDGTSETEQRDVAAIVDGTEDADDAAVVKGELMGSEIADSEADFDGASDRGSDCGPGCDMGMPSSTAPLLAITENGEMGTAGHEFTQRQEELMKSAAMPNLIMTSASSDTLATMEECGHDSEI